MRSDPNDKLSESVKVRFTPPQLHLAERECYKSGLYMGKWIRKIILAHLESQGYDVPRQMTCFQRWCHERDLEREE